MTTQRGQLTAMSQLASAMLQRSSHCSVRCFPGTAFLKPSIHTIGHSISTPYSKSSPLNGLSHEQQVDNITLMLIDM